MDIKVFISEYNEAISLALGDSSVEDIERLQGICVVVESFFGSRTHLLIKPYRILLDSFIRMGDLSSAYRISKRLVAILEDSYINGFEGMAFLYEDVVNLNLRMERKGDALSICNSAMDRIDVAKRILFAAQMRGVK